MINRRIRPLANDHQEDRTSCKWSPRGLATCQWSSGGTGHLLMIIRRIQPLANDHPEGLAYPFPHLKSSLSPPSYPYPKQSTWGSRALSTGQPRFSWRACLAIKHRARRRRSCGPAAGSIWASLPLHSFLAESQPGLVLHSARVSSCRKSPKLVFHLASVRSKMIHLIWSLPGILETGPALAWGHRVP